MKIQDVRGITVLELLVVVALIVVITGLSSLSYAMIKREKVIGATRELLADLQATRMNALTKGTSGYGIRFESATSYTLFLFRDCDNDTVYDAHSCEGPGREEDDIIVRTVAESVVLKKTNPGTDLNNDVLLFDRFGVPRKGNGSLGMMTIIVKNDDAEDAIHCIAISLNRIREGIWGRDSRHPSPACIVQ